MVTLTGWVMSERNQMSLHTALGRIVGVLLLAATAAACDRCGDFVPPIRLSADPELQVCRDETPKLR